MFQGRRDTLFSGKRDTLPSGNDFILWESDHLSSGNREFGRRGTTLGPFIRILLTQYCLLNKKIVSNQAKPWNVKKVIRKNLRSWVWHRRGRIQNPRWFSYHNPLNTIYQHKHSYSLIQSWMVIFFGGDVVLMSVKMA